MTPAAHSHDPHAAGVEAPTRDGAPSERVRLRRKRDRGSYERAVIDAILDEALVAHVGLVEHDGQPLVIPMLYARCGDLLAASEHECIEAARRYISYLPPRAGEKPPQSASKALA